MKKSRVGAVAAALPFLFLTACGAGDTGLALTANWYSNVNITSPVGTQETTEYTVSFEQTDPDDKFTAQYSDGVYKTTLTGENISYAEGNPVGYHLHAELSIKGRLTLNGEQGEEFTDSTVADVWFLNITEGLRPVRSVKTVDCHVPVSGASSVDASFLHYTYTYTADYAADLSTAAVSLVQTAPEASSEENTIKLKSKGSFFDNEEILFALRGVNLENSFSFRTVNTVQRLPATVQATAAASEDRTVTFSLNGVTEERTLSVCKTEITFTGTNRGGTQTLYYAKRTDPNANLYRNVLVRAEAPNLESLGTFIYTLKSATFNPDK